MAPHYMTKYIRSQAQLRSHTHFLAIPLLTPVSRPHFRASINNFLNDPVAAVVPTDAVRPLGTLHLFIGPMSLVTPARFIESSEILRTLNIRHALKVAATRPKEKAALHAEVVWQGETFPNKTTVPSPSPDDIAPIIVSVHGLSPGRPGTEAATHRLCTNVVDSTHRLRPLFDTIKDAYRNTNLLDNYEIFDPELKRLDEQNEASSIFYLNLIQSERTQQESIPDDRHQGKMRRPKLPRYDSDTS